MLMENKKGAELMNETVVMIVLVIVFFGIMFGFVFRSGTNIALYEQIYSKEIALSVDSAYPGTTIVYDLSRFEDDILNTGYENIVTFNDDSLTFKLSENSKGYTTKFFSNYKIDAKFDEDNRLKIFISEEDNE